MRRKLRSLREESMRTVRVGVTPSLGKIDPAQHAPTSDMVHSMVSSGMEPVVLDYPMNEKELLPVLDTLDGIIFAGGPDVHPRHFGQEVDPNIGTILEERDELELFLMKWVSERKLPILGVCRGMQLINVALGGTLHQDLVHNQGLIHRQTTDMVYFHDIIFDGPSMLREMVSSERYPTNSYHHQAVDRIAESLKVTAHAPDGIIEAYEGTGDQFILGTQWHPEDSYDNDALSRRIFLRFAEVCRER